MPFPTVVTQGGTGGAVVAPNLPQFARGVSALFEVDFFDDAPNNTIPAVPGNPSDYPSFTIVDPSGAQILTGVGIAGSAAGRWQTTWTVSNSAALSTQHQKWLIVWNMVTATGRQLQRTNPFDVIELRTPDTLDDLRSHSYLQYPGHTETLAIRLPKQVTSLSVQVYQTESLTNPTPKTTASFAGSLTAANVTEVPEQNLFTYVFETPNLTVGEYQVVWNYRYTPTSPSEITVQKLSVPPPVFFSLKPSLDTLIDKLRKRHGTVHAYDDGDMFDYFQKGIGILNGVTPVTNFDLLNFPYNAYTVRFLVEAAALWAIHAQHMLSGELQFSFSGQQITLDMDHTGFYSEVLNLLREDLYGDGKGSWPAAKIGLARTLGPMVVVNNRMMGGRQYGYVYKVSTSQIGSASPTVAQGTLLPGFGFNLVPLLSYLKLV